MPQLSGVILFQINSVRLSLFQVARRCLSYVQNCMHEMKLLKVEAVDGAVPSWILLTCLQVLSTCQNYVSSTGAANQAMEFFALLWNVAKDKLYELGRKCGLLPGSVVGSQQLHCIATISSGIVDSYEGGLATSDESAPATTVTRPTPVDKLKEALSCSTAFTKHYLVCFYTTFNYISSLIYSLFITLLLSEKNIKELSELAMGTFKHCGRLRSARLIGRDLSRFYIQLGQPHKSVNFLVDLLRGYHEEVQSWTTGQNSPRTFNSIVPNLFVPELDPAESRHTH